ncbi:MAG: aspartate kinase [Bacteroidales bacterium]
MHIYKFGGASVKDAASIKKIADILKQSERAKIIVISAMDKTTNALENLTEAYFTRDSANAQAIFEEIKNYHQNIYQELCGKDNHDQHPEFQTTLSYLSDKLQQPPSLNYDFEYDQIVPCGELLSTQIISAYLSRADVENEWIDARNIIRTDDSYREANIDWETSRKAFKRHLGYIQKHIITQGFIGSTPEGINTSLGREGSDYTAAIFGVLADAKDVTVWKDVPGIMNADPKRFDFSEKLPLISYQEAIELAYFGAKVIHPRTIKPLENKNIPLYVRSFINSKSEGTIIRKIEDEVKLAPVYIVKEEQILMSISPRDFSFIMEKHISRIFDIFDKFNAHVSISQNSAISYSVCFNCDKRKLPALIQRLSEDFKILYNENLELITIRHFTDEAVTKMLSGKEVILEQRSRNTARFVVRNLRKQ